MRSTVAESESQGRSWDCIERVEAERHRAGTRAQQAHDVVDVLEGALEDLGCERLLTVEVWTSRGLLTHHVLFVMSLAERVVHIAGITTWLGEAWMLQVGRNLIDEVSGALASKRYLIIDRDTKYTRPRNVC